MYKEVAYYCRVKGIETVNWRNWEVVSSGLGIRDTALKKAKSASRSGSGDARGKGTVKSLEQLTEGELVG